MKTIFAFFVAALSINASADSRQCLDALNILNAGMYYDSATDRYASMGSAVNMNVNYGLGNDNGELERQPGSASLNFGKGVMSVFMRRFCVNANGAKADCSIRAELPLTEELVAKFIEVQIVEARVSADRALSISSLNQDAITRVLNACGGTSVAADYELSLLAEFR
jgi:hypothetical protein